MRWVIGMLSLWFGCGLLLGQAPLNDAQMAFLLKVSDQATERPKVQVVYDPAYVVLPYPGGDVPADRGVCTDEVIRVYRKLGIDLQKEVHEDMKRNFGVYPKIWGLSRTDTNIDHRRVPNLRVFFARHGVKLPVTMNAKDYRAGELVTWDLPSGVPHIGMLVQEKSADGERCLVVHNIGAGPQQEDVLFAFKITGHYRYFGPGRLEVGH